MSNIIKLKELGVEDGKVYFAKVAYKKIDSGEWSEYSDLVKFTTKPSFALPNKAIVEAPTLGHNVGKDGVLTVRASYTHPDKLNKKSLIYRITRDSSDGEVFKEGELGLEESTVSGIEKNGQYYISVKNKDSVDGVSSSWSDAVIFSGYMTINPPVLVKDGDIIHTDTAVNFTLTDIPKTSEHTGPDPVPMYIQEEVHRYSAETGQVVLLGSKNYNLQEGEGIGYRTSYAFTNFKVGDQLRFRFRVRMRDGQWAQWTNLNDSKYHVLMIPAVFLKPSIVASGPEVTVTDEYVVLRGSEPIPARLEFQKAIWVIRDLAKGETKTIETTDREFRSKEFNGRDIDLQVKYVTTSGEESPLSDIVTIKHRYVHQTPLEAPTLSLIPNNATSVSTNENIGVTTPNPYTQLRIKLQEKNGGEAEYTISDTYNGDNITLKRILSDIKTNTEYTIKVAYRAHSTDLYSLEYVATFTTQYDEKWAEELPLPEIVLPNKYHLFGTTNFTQSDSYIKKPIANSGPVVGGIILKLFYDKALNWFYSFKVVPFSAMQDKDDDPRYYKTKAIGELYRNDAAILNPTMFLTAEFYTDNRDLDHRVYGPMSMMKIKTATCAITNKVQAFIDADIRQLYYEGVTNYDVNFDNVYTVAGIDQPTYMDHRYYNNGASIGYKSIKQTYSETVAGTMPVARKIRLPVSITSDTDTSLLAVWRANETHRGPLRVHMYGRRGDQSSTKGWIFPGGELKLSRVNRQDYLVYGDSVEFTIGYWHSPYGADVKLHKSIWTISPSTNGPIAVYEIDHSNDQQGHTTRIYKARLNNLPLSGTNDTYSFDVEYVDSAGRVIKKPLIFKNIQLNMSFTAINRESWYSRKEEYLSISRGNNVSTLNITALNNEDHLSLATTIYSYNENQVYKKDRIELDIVDIDTGLRYVDLIFNPDIKNNRIPTLTFSDRGRFLIKARNIYSNEDPKRYYKCRLVDTRPLRRHPNMDFANAVANSLRLKNGTDNGAILPYSEEKAIFTINNPQWPIASEHNRIDRIFLWVTQHDYEEINPILNNELSSNKSEIDYTPIRKPNRLTARCKVMMFISTTAAPQGEYITSEWSEPIKVYCQGKDTMLPDVSVPRPQLVLDSNRNRTLIPETVYGTPSFTYYTQPTILLEQETTPFRIGKAVYEFSPRRDFSFVFDSIIVPRTSSNPTMDLKEHLWYNKVYYDMDMYGRVYYVDQYSRVSPYSDTFRLVYYNPNNITVKPIVPEQTHINGSTGMLDIFHVPFYHYNEAMLQNYQSCTVSAQGYNNTFGVETTPSVNFSTRTNSTHMKPDGTENLNEVGIVKYELKHFTGNASKKITSYATYRLTQKKYNQGGLETPALIYPLMNDNITTGHVYLKATPFKSKNGTTHTKTVWKIYLADNNVVVYSRTATALNNDDLIEHYAMNFNIGNYYNAQLYATVEYHDSAGNISISLCRCFFTLGN